jgi:large subunit ribosomal protein L24
MKIKTGDTIKVLSGRDAGKTGKVIQVLFRDGKFRDQYVVVEGVNLRKKHMKSGKRGEKGQTIELASPIHASNVMLIDPSSKKPTRVGFKKEGGDKKRIAKVSGAFIE